MLFVFVLVTFSNNNNARRVAQEQTLRRQVEENRQDKLILIKEDLNSRFNIEFLLFLEKLIPNETAIYVMTSIQTILLKLATKRVVFVPKYYEYIIAGIYAQNDQRIPFKRFAKMFFTNYFIAVNGELDTGRGLSFYVDHLILDMLPNFNETKRLASYFSKVLKGKKLDPTCKMFKNGVVGAIDWLTVPDFRRVFTHWYQTNPTFKYLSYVALSVYHSYQYEIINAKISNQLSDHFDNLVKRFTDSSLVNISDEVIHYAQKFMKESAEN